MYGRLRIGNERIFALRFVIRYSMFNFIQIKWSNKRNKCYELALTIYKYMNCMYDENINR